MINLKRQLLLQSICHQKTDKTPIWLMRQAGRYLPEYRAIRTQAGSFMRLCKTPELACEVTLQPLKRFPLDAAILFSDILTIPDAMGMNLQIKENQGIFFENPLRNAQDIQNLNSADLKNNLSYVYAAIKLIKKELNGKVPLIGFCGSPWTVATYMLEGKASPTFPAIRKLLATDPKLLHTLLEKLAQAISNHLSEQIQAGVDVVMIFDTWGGMLDRENYEKFSLHYVKQIINFLAPQKIPLILFTKGGGKYFDLMLESGCQVIGLDWEMNLKNARAEAAGKIALQGNLNPQILYESPEKIRQAVAETLADYGPGSGHIFNLGHGIPPDVSPDAVSVLVEAVHEESIHFQG